MEKTLAILNQLEHEGVIGRYAIGGAVAAARYIEPAQTYDLDVFVALRAQQGLLLSLDPIYRRLGDMGYLPEGECILVEGWPVQFLPLHDSLTEDALVCAFETEFAGVPTRVFTAEHLAAIMLKTGRPKDHVRLISFVEQGALDENRFEAVLVKHGLKDKWHAFEARFLKA